MGDKGITIVREVELARIADGLSVGFGGGRVEPEKIAEEAGLPFAYRCFPEEFDGILLHEAGTFLLVCNDRRAPRGGTRSRFTFAHELGHYFIPEHRQALESERIPAHFSLAEFASGVPVEREADYFAAALLMPEKSFRAQAKTTAGGLECVSRLAAHFGTSLSSTAYRALALGVLGHVAAVFRWDQLGNLVGRRVSDSARMEDRRYLKVAMRPPIGSATANMVARLSTGSASRELKVADWFPEFQYERAGEGVLSEEVISLGHHGWLTITRTA